MDCQNCRQSVPDGEPIYRFATGWGLIWRDRWENQTTGSLCAKCASSVEEQSRQQQHWRPAEPCCHCGRPVILNGRRKKPIHVVCSVKCRHAAYAAAARNRARARQRSPGERSCANAACGEGFVPKRSDARYCSPACKQSAYRRRAAPDPIRQPAAGAW